MERIGIAIIILLLVFPAWAAQGLVLKVDLQADQVQMGPVDLGTLPVEGAGTVKLTARRDGTRITVQAIGGEGKVIGQAESVVGPKETLIYVTTKGGLKKLTILWK